MIHDIARYAENGDEFCKMRAEFSKAVQEMEHLLRVYQEPFRITLSKEEFEKIEKELKDFRFLNPICLSNESI